MIHKNAPSQWFGFKTLLDNKLLLGQLLRRRISQEHKHTWIGKIWIIAKPLSLLMLYVFVFGYVFEGKFKGDASESKATYALGVFLGLIVIHLITDVLAIAPKCMVDNASMVRKTTIPLEVIPASIVGTAVFHFLVGLALAAVGLFIFGHPPTLQALWMIPLTAFLILGTLGLSYLIAIIGAYVRDISQIVPVLSLGLLFSSAVFYSVEQIPPVAWNFLKFNPVLQVVDAIRKSLLWGEPLKLDSNTLFFCLSCIISYVIGYLVFSTNKERLADIV